jgi:hypothetical protein
MILEELLMPHLAQIVVYLGSVSPIRALNRTMRARIDDLICNKYIEAALNVPICRLLFLCKYAVVINTGLVWKIQIIKTDTILNARLGPDGLYLVEYLSRTHMNLLPYYYDFHDAEIIFTLFKVGLKLIENDQYRVFSAIFRPKSLNIYIKFTLLSMYVKNQVTTYPNVAKKVNDLNLTLLADKRKVDNQNIFTRNDPKYSLIWAYLAENSPVK